jgi:hypothetical protein
MAACMKVAKVESVLFDLAKVLRQEMRFSDFGLDNDNYRTGKNNQVDTFPQPVQGQLEQDSPIA